MKILIITSFLLISSASPLLAGDGQEYLLIADLTDRSLVLYEPRTNKELKHYPIAVPKNDWLPLPLFGKVTKIELNPFWYPTQKTRIAYLKKKKVELPKIIKPDDPRNPMGKAKILIEFENFKIPIRIHGTNEPKSIGKAVTRGCLRLKNEDLLLLVKIIKSSRTRVLIKKT